MEAAWILAVVLATVARGDITGTYPDAGACLCLSANGVGVRSSACGAVIGSSTSGECFKYSGVKSSCSLEKYYYEFFQVSWNGEDGWLSGTDLVRVSNASCGGDEGVGGEGRVRANEYTCQVTDSGKRIHETMSHTRYDCVDKSCRNTCRGGQCVAYVTCRCKRNGKWAPNTGCWRPGQRLKAPNGKCNRNVAPYTAIATFPSRSRYYGHAAVFIRCKDDYNILVYDQGCCRRIGYSTYSSRHKFFSTFYTITSPGCADRASWRCRVENSGSTCCPISVPGCKRASNWWEVVNKEEDEDEKL